MTRSVSGCSVTARARLERNSIHHHNQLGITFTNPHTGTPTPNDPGDADAGPNGQQNYPVLTAASTTSVSGTLSSAPSSTYHVELFASSVCDSSGYGEADRYLTSVDVTTNGDGDASFTVLVTGVATARADHEHRDLVNRRDVGVLGVPRRAGAAGRCRRRRCARRERQLPDGRQRRPGGRRR